MLMNIELLHNVSQVAEMISGSVQASYFATKFPISAGES